MSQVHQEPDLAVEIFVLEPVEEQVVGMHEHDVSGDEPAHYVAGDEPAS